MSGVFPNDLPRLNQLEKAAQVSAWLEGLHTKPNKANRIHQLCKEILSVGNGMTVEPNDPRHPFLIQALKDLSELWFAIQVFGASEIYANYADKVSEILSDAVLPVRADQTSGRDAQFELFVGALCKRAGLQPQQQPSGPDWLLALPSGRAAVEAKRVKLAGGFGSSVRGAKKQIRRGGVAGIVVLDISDAVGPDQHRFEHYVTDAQIDAAGARQMELFIKEKLPPIERELEGSSVGVIVVHDYALRPAAKSDTEFIPWTFFTFWRTFHLRSPSDGTRSYFENVAGLLSLGLPSFI
jgi:hypothetical protein